MVQAYVNYRPKDGGGRMKHMAIKNEAKYKIESLKKESDKNGGYLIIMVK